MLHAGIGPSHGLFTELLFRQHLHRGLPGVGTPHALEDLGLLLERRRYLAQRRRRRQGSGYGGGRCRQILPDFRAHSAQATGRGARHAAPVVLQRRRPRAQAFRGDGDVGGRGPRGAAPSGRRGAAAGYRCRATMGTVLRTASRTSSRFSIPPIWAHCTNMSPTALWVHCCGRGREDRSPAGGVLCPSMSRVTFGGRPLLCRSGV